ncbi:predicted protein [Scheffersomyces stipitis CBS 6054]|uniref:Uncharacterized protein n=1 Tax=Scheffersomyces stipitis (strain ATCC 58785 / CBS 6054 / NBRC 10063 / NRRL Y-11545) TaxID=322104 RepID=A3LYL2_PICST|nr:predicted protein [Scheffersomyces stipitis CBS 6054]ABN68190.1 predicted protein [Scheffersomyces stipitis CBS 6054]KAG2731194.1 hypothetical protein G9P44_005610 [Scheffersomyces stipitis]
MTASTNQNIIVSDDEKLQNEKRRAIYIRPFLLFYVNSLIAEVVFLLVAIFIMSGTDDIINKVLWTLVFCPLGMGGAMGGIVNVFIVDKYYGSKAIYLTTVISVLVLGGCNILCYNLDLVFHFFGASDHPLWFHWRYPMIAFVGYSSGKLLFTDEGQKQLASFGV